MKLKLQGDNLDLMLGILASAAVIVGGGCVGNHAANNTPPLAAPPMTSSGPMGVNNNTTETAPLNGVPDDSTVQMHVTAALNGNPDYKFEHVQVVVANGTVQLNGTVDNPGQKASAASIAGGVSGVKAVVNNLNLSSQ